MKITKEKLAAMIDHTFLKADGAAEAIAKLCDEAAEYHFGCVMVNAADIVECRARLAGTGVKVGTVIDFPLGRATPAVRQAAALDALNCGADELDFVLDGRRLKFGERAQLIAEYTALVQALKTVRADAVTKIILECCYLNDEEKRAACSVAVAAGFDFVKTSTGFGTGGATVHDVELMRSAVPPTMGVKAAGGIRTLDDALALIAAGANRLGCSAGVALLRNYEC